MKMKHKYPEFSDLSYTPLPSHIADHTYSVMEKTKSSSWVNQLSFGGLTKPSNKFLNVMVELEKQFISIHGESFLKEPNILKNLIKRLNDRYKEVPIEVIKLYAKTRIHIRCKYLNKVAKEQAILKAAEKQIQLKLKQQGSKEQLSEQLY